MSKTAIPAVELPETISEHLLSTALAMLSNDDLDCLDDELCDFAETGAASPRVARMLQVLSQQDARRREKAA